MSDFTFLAGPGVKALYDMNLIRRFEQRLGRYSEEGLIRGSTHPAVGMEAVAVGVSMALEPQDSIASNHRGHGHCLARGADPARLLMEIFGRAGGYSRGKGGSMHVGIRELGILGTNGIVGAGIGLATGAALAHRLRGTDGVAVAYFGDGAINQGVFHESLNLASIWKLPLVLVCENNRYAQSAALSDMVVDDRLERRAAPFGVPATTVDGMDVEAVHDAARTATSRARKGLGPELIVAETYRFLGHMVGDTEIYRDEAEVEQWLKRDPLTELSERLIAAMVLSRSQVRDIDTDAVNAVDAAERLAGLEPFPEAAEAVENVYEVTR
ncbi:thiamine pyrophosphate-dependent dehydrogenase E1 component subunit alpha [Amycolatopsis sp. H20-H5]|uniref:thiamine pyrophosphate-dependent dehydrogenase E1 component subunit alpha n=1 Tax=Amycolatopsis sp. H20-H5 TaxID=3046309 RepID=UPI002DB9051B|nr:thiamine pyrophosphate-dependent dehydrogenase E1 component subunit alpha [Amycolatopsis sp. H20-H5]MEC3976595.1 thiamine pyrophosphate-dependent dehydrogenase E1 component subunit alpha [Amycolatopsis sp. H20-H5]